MTLFCLQKISNKQDAKDILEKIKIFLRDNLELELNDKTAIFKSNQGVNFCGYKINEYRLKIRDKGKRKFKKKNKKLLRAVKVGAISSKEARQKKKEKQDFQVLQKNA